MYWESELIEHTVAFSTLELEGVEFLHVSIQHGYCSGLVWSIAGISVKSLEYKITYIPSFCCCTDKVGVVRVPCNNVEWWTTDPVQHRYSGCLWQFCSKWGLVVAYQQIEVLVEIACHEAGFDRGLLDSVLDFKWRSIAKLIMSVLQHPSIENLNLPLF